MTRTLIAVPALVAAVFLKTAPGSETECVYRSDDYTVNGAPCAVEVRTETPAGPEPRPLGEAGTHKIEAAPEGRRHTFTLPGADGGYARIAVTLPRGKHAPVWPQAMPRFAGGRASFAAESGATRTSFVSVGPAEAGVFEEARGAFRAAGWTETVSSGDFALFSKNGSTAAVLDDVRGGIRRVSAVQRLGSF